MSGVCRTRHNSRHHVAQSKPCGIYSFQTTPQAKAFCWQQVDGSNADGLQQQQPVASQSDKSQAISFCGKPAKVACRGWYLSASSVMLLKRNNPGFCIKALQTRGLSRCKARGPCCTISSTCRSCPEFLARCGYARTSFKASVCCASHQSKSATASESQGKTVLVSN